MRSHAHFAYLHTLVAFETKLTDLQIETEQNLHVTCKLKPVVKVFLIKY